MPYVFPTRSGPLASFFTELIQLTPGALYDRTIPIAIYDSHPPHPALMPAYKCIAHARPPPHRRSERFTLFSSRARGRRELSMHLRSASLPARARRDRHPRGTGRWIRAEGQPELDNLLIRGSARRSARENHRRRCVLRARARSTAHAR